MELYRRFRGCRQMDRQREGPTDSERNRQTDRQTETGTDGQREGQTGMQREG